MAKLLTFLCACFALGGSAAEILINDSEPLRLPEVGAHGLHILAPDTLELVLVTSKKPDPARLTEWNFVDDKYQFHGPSPAEFEVRANGKKIAVTAVGFRRRPLYAPLKVRDLRIGNHLFLRLASPIGEKQAVQVSAKFLRGKQFTAVADPLRWSPVVHINQEGFALTGEKKAIIGYYLGNLGELPVENLPGYDVVDSTGKTVFEGTFQLRKDIGYQYDTLPYQHVAEADFSGLTNAGQYRVVVAGVGASFPFFIDEGIPALFARTYALGLYHQRCGTDNALPFTRFLHGPCHTRKAEIPNSSFKTANRILENMTGDWQSNKRHTAPRLKNLDSSLYPFVTRDKVDASGGHHDAGDYSKYTINVAQLIHALVFAADAFPGVGLLDNLGLPESGDGKSDVLQEAKWEADFLAKLQDADGGFYFLVYPRDREYEDNVPPDRGDPQIVFPKTTAATAAAVAALAQTSSSPLFRKQFPLEAKVYLEKARKGWDFLERAWSESGRDGSYQKITHYGDEFMHDDEIAWAATELFLATGQEKFDKILREKFDPTDRETKRWTWVRMFESYGCAIRSYAFAAKTGRMAEQKLDRSFLKKCEEEIIAACQDQVRFADQSAYPTSFPDPSKKFRNAGWYFSSDHAFDIATACALDFPKLNDPRGPWRNAIIENLSYEAGCNPVNVSFVSGLGYKRPREMVNQYAQNDRRILPPTGLPFGNIQEGFPYLDNYKKELGTLTFPSDGDEKNPYPFYDRWGDTFNTSAEFVTVNVGRAFAAAAYLMGRTSLTNQPWKPGPVSILQLPSADGIAARLDLREKDAAKIKVVWEAAGQEPALLDVKKPFRFTPTTRGEQWVEAEAYLPDGRRYFAITNLTVLR